MAEPLSQPPVTEGYTEAGSGTFESIQYPQAPNVNDFIEPGSGTFDAPIDYRIPPIGSGYGIPQVADPTALFDSPGGFFGSTFGAQTQGQLQTQQNYNSQPDWRVRLSLAPGASYLYNAASEGDILAPLQATNGVIFPYTPQVNVSYRANYDPAEVTHSNYRLFFYKNSAVDDIQIIADFTAQDTGEASYILAVIHFFKSVTKMFYGQDANPNAGTPPPLCYLTGLGQYQFNNHPLLVTNFQYSLPNDVDYIRAGSTTQYSGQNLSSYQQRIKGGGFLDAILGRLRGAGLSRGAMSGAPKFNSLSNTEATYVPTKIQFSISCVPVVSRNDISRNFSLEQYGSGSLTKKGIW
jgi:hypothetical protein